MLMLNDENWRNPDNTSGFIKTYEYHCLIRLPIPAETTKGGIFLPQTSVMQRLMACNFGLLIDFGDKAFEGGGFGEHKPKRGDMVCFEKYAGMHPVIGEDGYYYRTVPDYKIGHLIKEGFEPSIVL